MKVHICSFFTSSCFLHIVWCYYNEFQTRLQAEKDKVSRVIKKPNRNKHSRIVTWHIHKQTICLRSETHWKLLLYLDFCSFFGKYWPKLLQCSTIFAFAAPWYLQEKLLVIHRVNSISQISSLSWMKHDSAPKIVAWKHKCWVTSRRIPTGSARYIASNKYAWTRQDCSPLRLLVTRL